MTGCRKILKKGIVPHKLLRKDVSTSSLSTTPCASTNVSLIDCEENPIPKKIQKLSEEPRVSFIMDSRKSVGTKESKMKDVAVSVKPQHRNKSIQTVPKL